MAGFAYDTWGGSWASAWGETWGTLGPGLLGKHRGGFHVNIGRMMTR